MSLSLKGLLHKGRKWWQSSWEQTWRSISVPHSGLPWTALELCWWHRPNKLHVSSGPNLYFIKSQGIRVMGTPNTFQSWNPGQSSTCVFLINWKERILKNIMSGWDILLELVQTYQHCIFNYKEQTTPALLIDFYDLSLSIALSPPLTTIC